MLYSIQRAVSDGAMTLLPVSIEYFDRSEIKVAFDDVVSNTGWAWVGTTDRTLAFSPPVPNGVEVSVIRTTDMSELRHHYALGAQFTAESMDESFKQVLHISQEASERQLGGDFFVDVNMHGYQITNLGTATAPDHAVTLLQYQTDANGASTARDIAVASAASASSSASAAAASASSASTSASGASGSASAANVSATAASSYSSYANAAASTATTKAAEAATSATNASASAAAASVSEVNAAVSAAAAMHPWEVEGGGIHYDSGNIRIGGQGARITGDFSNAIPANRVLFQTSTVNGITSIGAVPHGSGATAQFTAFSYPDTANTQSLTLQADNTAGAVKVMSNASGTAPYVPMLFYTGGLERMRIDTAGNVGIGLASGGSKLSVAGNAELRGPQNGTATSVVCFLKGLDGTQAGYWGYSTTASPMEYVNNRGTGHAWYDSGVERMRIDPSGNVVVTNPSGLGYGIGAGGTVTQATSKSTAVTLNKPTGQITMSNAALAAGASVSFNVVNSLATTGDVCVVGISWGIDPSKYSVRAGCGSGYLQITVKNETAGSLSEALAINFALIKGAIA